MGSLAPPEIARAVRVAPDQNAGSQGAELEIFSPMHSGSPHIPALHDARPLCRASWGMHRHFRHASPMASVEGVEYTSADVSRFCRDRHLAAQSFISVSVLNFPKRKPLWTSSLSSTLRHCRYNGSFFRTRSESEQALRVFRLTFWLSDWLSDEISAVLGD